MQRVFIVGGKPYILSPPTGWALDLIAQNGIDYLNPKYPLERAKLDAEYAPVFDADGNPEMETVLTPIPPDMSLSRMVSVTLAALLTEHEGLDAMGHPIRVWTPEQVLIGMKPEATEAYALFLAELVNEPFAEKAEKPKTANPPTRRPKPSKKRRGGAKR